MTGPLPAAAAGVGFGAFQTLNRRAVGGMSDAYLATFLQLLVAMLVLLAASAATEGLGPLRDATRASLVCSGAAGLVHFFVGWTLLNMSQMRIGAARTSPCSRRTPSGGRSSRLSGSARVRASSPGSRSRSSSAALLVVALERVEETGWGSAGRRRCRVSRPRSRGRSARSSSRKAARMDSPLLGLTLGMAVAFVAYAAVLPLRPKAEGASSAPGRRSPSSSPRASSSASRCGRVGSRSTRRTSRSSSRSGCLGPCRPRLLAASHGRHVERVTLAVWSGAALVVGGALLLIGRLMVVDCHAHVIVRGLGAEVEWVDGAQVVRPRRAGYPRGDPRVRRPRADPREQDRAGVDVVVLCPWVKPMRYRDGTPERGARGDGRRPRRRARDRRPRAAGRLGRADGRRARERGRGARVGQRLVPRRRAVRRVRRPRRRPVRSSSSIRRRAASPIPSSTSTTSGTPSATRSRRRSRRRTSSSPASSTTTPACASCSRTAAARSPRSADAWPTSRRSTLRAAT